VFWELRVRLPFVPVLRWLFTMRKNERLDWFWMQGPSMPGHSLSLTRKANHLDFYSRYRLWRVPLNTHNSKGDPKAVLGPGHLEVSDDEGFKAALGVEENLVTPRTGETHKTSAASLLLFDKNKNVIWKAP
jgi:hypothetical protein